MSKPFRILEEKMSPQVRTLAKQKARQLLTEMTLDELIEAIQSGQEHLIANKLFKMISYTNL